MRALRDLLRLPRRAAGGAIGPAPDRQGSVPVVLSRGEAYVSRAAWDSGRARMQAAIGAGPNAHIYVVEPDGRITDTET